jgi:hypothetical protein
MLARRHTPFQDNIHPSEKTKIGMIPNLDITFQSRCTINVTAAEI